MLTKFHVWASRQDDGSEPELYGRTLSYPEALEWEEQARQDGWARAWIEEAPVEPPAA